MASIGLQINHSTAGTDIGAALAKALMPNVGDQVDIARLKSQLETDEYQRRLLREQTTKATYDAIAQAKQNQYKQAEFDAKTDEGPILGKILQDQQAQRNAAAATEAPVVVPDTVLQSGGRGMPEVLTGSYYPPAEATPAPPPPPAPEVLTQPSYGQEPDWQYRVNQFPLRADEPPVPVELPPDFTGPMTNAPVAAMPGLGGQPMLPEAPVPIADSDRPLIGGGRELPARSVGAPASTPMPGFLQHLLRPISELRPGEPTITTPETSAMLAGMDQPAERPSSPPPDGTLGGLQLPTEAPVPIEAGQPPVTAPVINPLAPDVPPEPPIAVGEPETITLPGRPPVASETTAAVPPAAAAAPATAETPTVPPTPAQPAIEEPLPPNKITTKAPGSVGTATVNADGSSTYHTDQGPVPLTVEQTNKLGLAIAYGADPGGQTGKLAGIIKTTYDPGVTLTPNQKAELLSGVSPIGTPEETASKIAIDKAKGEIKTTMIADRAYTLSKTPDGRTVATLVEGQPAAKRASRFGESAEGYMRTGVSDLMVSKPDPKTWDATERQDFAIMVDALYGAKVTVSENGKITVISGKLPEGVLPGSAGFNASNPPPPTVAETPPAGTQAAPAAPAPVSTAPAPAGQQPAAEGGRPTEMVNGVQVKNYGGWLRTGEQPKQATSDTAAGKVTQIESTGPTDMDEQVGKEFGYTKNVLTPGKYLLDLTSDKVPNVAGQVIQAVTSNNSLLQTLGSMALTPAEREYFQNVQRFINAVTHKSSGADVTAADLRTYGYLFSLPPKEKVAASDLRTLKNAVIEDIKNSRTGWNGRVPSSQLREFDLDLARRGYDLDKVYTDADAGMVEAFDVEEK